MCLVCPVVAIVVGATVGGALILKGIKHTWPKSSTTYPPTPKPQPVPQYGEDLED